MITISRRGMMFVLSSPSGAGKTTLSRKLLERQKASSEAHSMTMSISVTTRAPRPGEVDGVDYFFVSRNAYEAMVSENALLEYAQVFSHHYGTPANFVLDHLNNGTDVLFDIDWQGTRQLATRNRTDVVSVFILPPSMAELERRLRARAQDSDEVVRERMNKAAAEISHWHEYDYVLINEDLEITLSRVEAILIAERAKRERQVGLQGFVEDL